MTNDVPKGKFGILEVFWQRKADKMAEGEGSMGFTDGIYPSE